MRIIVGIAYICVNIILYLSFKFSVLYVSYSLKRTWLFDRDIFRCIWRFSRIISLFSSLSEVDFATSISASFSLIQTGVLDRQPFHVTLNIRFLIE